jgi:hypothetical protein
MKVKINFSQFLRKSDCFLARNSIIAANGDGWKRNFDEWIVREISPNCKCEEDQCTSIKDVNAEPHESEHLKVFLMRNKFQFIFLYLSMFDRLT